MNAKTLKILSMLATVVSVGVTIFVQFVGQKEMEALRRFVDERLLIDPYPYLKAGQRVYVRSGPLAGIEGFIVRKNSKCRLIVSVEMMMQSVSVEVDESTVEPLFD